MAVTLSVNRRPFQPGEFMHKAMPVNHAKIGKARIPGNRSVPQMLSTREAQLRHGLRRIHFAAIHAFAESR